MSYVRMFLLKLAVTFVLLGVTLPILTAPVTVGGVAAATLGVGVIGFILGDLLVLPVFGEVPAFFGDVLIATLALWLLPAFIAAPPLSMGAAFTAAVALSLGEFFLHRALKFGWRVRGPG